MGRGREGQASQGENNRAERWVTDNESRGRQGTLGQKQGTHCERDGSERARDTVERVRKLGNGGKDWGQGRNSTQR